MKFGFAPERWGIGALLALNPNECQSYRAEWMNVKTGMSVGRADFLVDGYAI